jgi:hypothetical protein
MIELTHEQRQGLRAQPPTARDPETGDTYVLIKADIYQRLRRLLEDDDGLTACEVGALIDAAMHEDDAGDPLLESYQDYRKP